MLWDTHLHTHFSSDSQAMPEKVLQTAIEAGLLGVCFTDHLDLDYPFDEDGSLLDLPAYFANMLLLKDTYADRIPIGIGIEVGLQPHLSAQLAATLSGYSPDFLIGSSHVVSGRDPYYPEYYENRTETAAYLAYFSSILENIAAIENFDVYGHIDYVVRYGPNKNKFYSYHAYQDIIDEILKVLIQKGKGIEINTGGFRYGLSHPNPTEEIIKRYRELGGEIITIGSDAHKPEHVAYDFNKVPAILKEAGFSYYTVFKERKPIFIPL